jgi:hypothetical protein
LKSIQVSFSFRRLLKFNVQKYKGVLVPCLHDAVRQGIQSWAPKKDLT